MGAAPTAFGRSGRSRSQAVPRCTDKIGDEPGGQKRPARRVAARRPPDASKSSPILPGIGLAFLLSSGLRAATQPPIESRDRLLYPLPPAKRRDHQPVRRGWFGASASGADVSAAGSAAAVSAAGSGWGSGAGGAASGAADSGGRS